MGIASSREEKENIIIDIMTIQEIIQKCETIVEIKYNNKTEIECNQMDLESLKNYHAYLLAIYKRALIKIMHEYIDTVTDYRKMMTELKTALYEYRELHKNSIFDEDEYVKTLMKMDKKEFIHEMILNYVVNYVNID